MDFEQEFRSILIRLAECRIDIAAWKDWWRENAAEVKKRTSPGDFSRLNCAPSAYGPNTFMLKCQNGAERYLTKMKWSFQHSDAYSKAAGEEFRKYQERLEQKRIAGRETEQKQREQRNLELQELSGYMLPDGGLRQSGLRTLPAGAKNAELIKLLIEWTEFLANKEYKEAFEMFQHYHHKLEWTSELLESAVYGYGCPGYTKEEAKALFGTSDYQVTSLWNVSDRDHILRQIGIDYYRLTEEQARSRCLTGTDYEHIIGDIHYQGVPLNGEESDLTAIFFIKEMDGGKIYLCFYDLHVL